MTIKNIIYIAIASTAMMFASCSEDGGFTPQTSTIAVTKVTSTSIDAAGCTKDTIILNMAPTKAYSPSAWLNVKATNNMIEVSAGPNDSREKRNAVLIMKNGDNDSTIINISQEGLVLRYGNGERVIVHSYKQTTVSTNIICNEHDRLQIISSPSWIEPLFSKDTLTLNVAENKKGNTAGDIRTGYVKYTVGTAIDSIKVIQYYWTNFRGDNKWLLYGSPVSFDEYGSYYLNTQNSSYLPANLTFFGKEAKFTFKGIKFFSNLPEVDLTLNATLDYETMSFSFKNGQVMGNIGDSIYIAETTIGAGFTRTFSTAPEARFDLDVSDDGLVSGRITGKFPVDGGNLDIIGLWFCVFKSNEFSQDAYYGQGRGDIWGLTPCYLLMPKKE